MLKILLKFGQILKSDIPFIGFSFDSHLIFHLFRDGLVAFGSGKILFWDFGFDLYDAYLAGANIAVFFGAGYQTGRGTYFWKQEPDGHDFFDPISWLMSVIAGFGVFCFMTKTFQPLEFIKLLGIWMLGSTTLYIINRLLDREIIKP